MQIPLIAGAVTDPIGNFCAAYPTNLEPCIVESGISKGFLRSAPGIRALATGPGEDRGSILWNGALYRVMGTSLVRVTGSTVTVLGDVGGSGPVSMDYSFDLLAIASGGNLFYWDGATLTQVTDPDLGTVLTVMWIDGYFMVTDGFTVAVTELNDPFSVDPLKYGSSEVDPDPIVGFRKVRGEAYFVNTNTIENMQNVGGNGFPFQRNPGGMIPKGATGTFAVCDYLETFAFVGCGRDEAASVYVAAPGSAASISTPQVDREIAALSDLERASIEIEAIVEENEQRLLIHLPEKTLVYSYQASKQAGSPVWHVLAGGTNADEQYPARHFTLAAGRWVGGSADGEVGYLDRSIETQFGQVAGWNFETLFLFNETRGAIVQALELVGVPGLAPFGEQATCFLSMTRDGRTWSQEWAISSGNFGQRGKRIQWRPKMMFRNYGAFRFRGANTAMVSWARLEAQIESLRA